MEPWYAVHWPLAAAAAAIVVATLAAYALRARRAGLREEELVRLVRERTEQLEEANRKLEELSFVDSLTDIGNRRQFERMLDLEWRRAVRSASPLSLIIADIDHFKAFNDRFGHAAGDECLRQLAMRLETTLSDASIIARIGGDEFALLLCSAAGPSHLRHRLDQAVKILARPVIWSGIRIGVSASIGATLLRPGLQHDPERRFAEADSALYVAKAAGRNCLRLFGDPVQDAATTGAGALRAV